LEKILKHLEIQILIEQF